MSKEDANPQTQQSDQNITQGQMMPQGQMMAYPPGVMPMMGPGMMPMGPGMMPMGPGMMPGMGYGPGAFIYIEDPMLELANCTGAIIRQEVEMFEIVSGCETQNRYHVFLQSQMGLKYAFKCIERSGCCGRCCCSNERRGLKMDIRHIRSAVEDPDLAKLFVQAEKPCSLGCCCLCRPQMDIVLTDSNKYIGKIRELCTCCDNIETEIYNKSGLKYVITGSCCQLGFCCGSSVQKIAEIEFKIKSNNQVVGAMKKLNASMGEYFSKADSYKIAFPLDATPEEKMLLICAGLMIDYQNFEKERVPHRNRKAAGLKN